MSNLGSVSLKEFPRADQAAWQKFDLMIACFSEADFGCAGCLCSTQARKMGEFFFFLYNGYIRQLQGKYINKQSYLSAWEFSELEMWAQSSCD